MNYETKYEIGQEIVLKVKISKIISKIDDDDISDTESLFLSPIDTWARPSEIEACIVLNKEEQRVKILEEISELQSKLKELEETN